MTWLASTQSIRDMGQDATQGNFFARRIERIRLPDHEINIRWIFKTIRRIESGIPGSSTYHVP